jgi:hypothetical protein
MSSEACEDTTTTFARIPRNSLLHFISFIRPPRPPNLISDLYSGGKTAPRVAASPPRAEALHLPDFSVSDLTFLGMAVNQSYSMAPLPAAMDM